MVVRGVGVIVIIKMMMMIMMIKVIMMMMMMMMIVVVVIIIFIIVITFFFFLPSPAPTSPLQRFLLLFAFLFFILSSRMHTKQERTNLVFTTDGRDDDTGCDSSKIPNVSERKQHCSKLRGQVCWQWQVSWRHTVAISHVTAVPITETFGYLCESEIVERV